MKYLGIDYGDRHVGFALGDDETNVSMPFCTITYDSADQLIQKIEDLVTGESVGSIVVGIPSDYRGQRSDQKQKEKTQQFIERLRSSVSVPVMAQDESYTSRQATRHIREAGISTKDDHSIAAMLILQSFLESQSMRKKRSEA